MNDDYKLRGSKLKLLLLLFRRDFVHRRLSLSFVFLSLLILFSFFFIFFFSFNLNLNLNLSLLYMADSKRNTTTLQKPSRLQKRAPSSLQINRSIEWNVAIPLLSPLSSSPPPQLADTRPSQGVTAEPEKVIVTFKNWQHPAAPFCHEQAPLVPLRL